MTSLKRNPRATFVVQALFLKIYLFIIILTISRDGDSKSVSPSKGN